MQANIGRSPDGKLEIIPMHKKLSMVILSKVDNKKIFEWSFAVKYGKTGVPGIYYMTWKDAEIEVDKQWKHFITDNPDKTPQRNSSVIVERTNAVINLFPWKTFDEKKMNYIKLMWLKEKLTGYWNPNKQTWSNVGSVGFATLSRVNGSDDVYGAGWDDDDASVNRYFQRFPSAFVACEDC